MVAGLDRYLDRELASLPERRLESWGRSLASAPRAGGSSPTTETGRLFLEPLLATAETNR
jgi:hypothetical protein